MRTNAFDDVSSDVVRTADPTLITTDETGILKLNKMPGILDTLPFFELSDILLWSSLLGPAWSRLDTKDIITGSRRASRENTGKNRPSVPKALSPGKFAPQQYEL